MGRAARVMADQRTTLRNGGASRLMAQRLAEFLFRCRRVRQAVEPGEDGHGQQCPDDDHRPTIGRRLSVDLRQPRPPLPPSPVPREPSKADKPSALYTRWKAMPGNRLPVCTAT